VLCAAVSAYSVLQSLVVPALGTLQRHLHTTATGTAWILTAYLLSASVLTPVTGILGDLYGKKRALVWSLVAVRTTNSATFLLGFGMFGAWMFIPLLVQQDPRSGVGFGAPATAVGLYLLPSAAGTVVVTPLVARLRATRGPRSPVFLGGLIAAAGYGWLALAHDGQLVVGLAVLLEGIGIGLAFAAVAILAVESVAPDQTGISAGINTIMRTVGGTLGSTVAGTLLASVTSADGQPANAAYTVAFAAFAGSMAVCAAVGLRISRERLGMPPTPDGG
jgi:MFS family permease